MMLGVGPYITATIIMQLLTLMSPKLKAMYQEEGEAGRAKFSQYSRLLTLPLALLQATGFLILLEEGNGRRATLYLQFRHKHRGHFRRFNAPHVARRTYH